MERIMRLYAARDAYSVLINAMSAGMPERKQRELNWENRHAEE